MGFPARTPSCQHTQRRQIVHETVNTQAPPMDDSHWSRNSEQQSAIEMTRQLIKGAAVIPL